MQLEVRRRMINLARIVHQRIRKLALPVGHWEPLGGPDGRVGESENRLC